MPECLLTPAEAAELLGIARPTLYEWARERRIPSVKLFGRALRFRASDIEHLIQRSTVKALPATLDGDDSGEMRRAG